jgi:hypothetical protein
VADIGRTFVREPSVQDATAYQRRVHELATAYLVLFLGCLVGLGLVIWQAQHLVTLAQRSNVETLTLAFILVFFGYLAVISASGAAGALRIGSYAIRVRLAGDRRAIERDKQRALGNPSSFALTVALNAILEREGNSGEPFTFPVEDSAGSLGVLEVRGAELRQLEAHGGGSNSLFAYFVQQLTAILRARGVMADLDVVQWGKIDDEATRQYVALTHFAWRLAERLGGDPLWPTYVLTPQDCATLQRRLEEICPALRDEAFLPDWEYRAEHKLPLIPEPLGLISLSRSEQRVDPVSTIGCAVLIVLAIVLVLGIMIIFPPWVPGK